MSSRPLLSPAGASPSSEKWPGENPEPEPEPEPEQGGTVLQTGLNIANTLEGMGLLGLPYSVRLAGGWAFAAVGLVCVISVRRPTTAILTTTACCPGGSLRDCLRLQGYTAIVVQAQSPPPPQLDFQGFLFRMLTRAFDQKQ